MSGRRCRALAAAFQARHGRAPNRTVWVRGGYYECEWRKLKKGARHEASASAARLVADSVERDRRRARKAAARRRTATDRVVVPAA